MPLDMPSYLEDRRKFLANRQTFPLDELAKHLRLPGARMGRVSWQAQRTPKISKSVFERPEKTSFGVTSKGFRTTTCSPIKVLMADSATPVTMR